MLELVVPAAAAEAAVLVGATVVDPEAAGVEEAAAEVGAPVAVEQVTAEGTATP